VGESQPRTGFRCEESRSEEVEARTWKRIPAQIASRRVRVGSAATITYHLFEAGDLRDGPAVARAVRGGTD